MPDLTSFVVSGPPLDPTLTEHLDETADQLLRAAAETWPDRVAVVTADESVTFAELDSAVDAFARYLGRRLGGTGSVVAVTSLLDIDFVVAYYAVLRSGNLVAPLNPLLPAPAIAHNLGTVRARLAIASPEVAERIARVRAELESLVDIVPLGEVRKLGGTGTAHVPVPADAPACVLFTSGTTGASKAVTLSHRNIAINAAQVAQAHELRSGSISAVNLPTYHPMHLNPAVLTGTTQVLCPVPDPIRPTELAREHGATHYYSMPAWLTRLATHPGLPATRIPTLRMIASGGSALPVDVAGLLSTHFQVPVFQGYGLAETSPLTHSDRPRTPARGSVGYPVASTQCVVVDLDTGETLPPGKPGEIRVRGPQVMLGYLGDEPGAHLDADGWFPTGDIGRLNPDGRLYLIDRIKDVFKRDNWLVSPAAIEQRLREHADVVECVVVDYPDKFTGAVATGFVVLRPGTPASLLDEITAFTNREAPPYEHLEFLEVVDEIPRSANGKIQRRHLREEMIRRRQRT